MQQLVLVTRYPAPGRVKTRLIPAIGPANAASVQRRLTKSTGALIRTLPGDILLDIYFTGTDLQQMRHWLGEDLHYSAQPEGSLGEKLAAKAAAPFLQSDARVVFIGADCPTLTAQDILSAFDVLNRCEIVIGQALDGGYYLLGLSRFAPQLFESIPWGSEQVFSTTLETCQAVGLTVGLLPPRRDLDRPEDLQLLEKASGSG